MLCWRLSNDLSCSENKGWVHKARTHTATIVNWFLCQLTAFTRTVAFQKIGDTERVTRCVMVYYDVTACRKLSRWSCCVDTVNSYWHENGVVCGPRWTHRNSFPESWRILKMFATKDAWKPYSLSAMVSVFYRTESNEEESRSFASNVWSFIYILFTRIGVKALRNNFRFCTLLAPKKKISSHWVTIPRLGSVNEITSKSLYGTFSLSFSCRNGEYSLSWKFCS